MKLSQGKIKDFVEPQAYDEVHDLAAEPARALAAYRFTDATSDLLARWLDALADLPRSRGAARALAGLRGVGKSHTLAAFSALVSSQALRATVADAHVATSARRLASRRHTVVSVERGARASFQEELAAAFVKAFGGHLTEWSGDPQSALARAVERTRGGTLVVVCDTAYGRAARVARDDGAALAALADAARTTDAFVALALDDDIAGAEGANVALTRSFQIDYLEPEHLYQIADNHLFRKSATARDRLHEIYLALRQSVPRFNWSEPRFAALYPIHPLVAEASAAVRLHAHTFAFLPFAARAAERAVNRPALSLVLLDEVFDHAERELRAAKDLREAFAAYDALSAKAIAQFPALQRLQVRLVLKNLFILSLDGRGASAGDLAAALLLQDGDAPQTAVARVEEMLRRLCEAAPSGSIARTSAGEEICHRFLVGSHGGFEDALAKAVKLPLTDTRAVARLLDALARSRFEDFPATGGLNAGATNTPAGQAATRRDAGDACNFSVEWRGSTRAGRVVRVGGDARSADAAGAPSPGDESCEWELFVLEPGADAARFEQALSSRVDEGAASAPSPVALVWQPAELTAEEYSLLRRLHALRGDATLASFGEAARVATTTLAARAERVWSRLYLDEGVLSFAGERFRFTAEARSAPTLARVLADVLAPHFDALHAEHPRLAAALHEQDVARLVGEFFSGANTTDATVQQLAEQFAVPLGLAVPRGNGYAHASVEEARRAPWVADVLALVERAGNQSVSVEELRRATARAPFGLRREAQHLVLAALVACGRVELVTRAGGLISRRTLGRAVNWEEIAGARRAATGELGADELAAWARRLTAREDVAPLTDAAARDSARAALASWLEGWRAANPLASFDEMADDGLTTRAARLAGEVRSTFGAAADAVESALAGDAPLEDALQRVAECFGSSIEEFARASARLEELGIYAEGVAARERVRDYLLLAEPTGVEEIECARRELLSLAEDPHTLFDAESRARFQPLWKAFRGRYAAHYTEAHDRAVGSRSDTTALDEFTQSAAWREFEALARLPFVEARAFDEAARRAARARPVHCQLPVADLLEAHPRCACPFRLADAEELGDSLAALEGLTERGRADYRRALASRHAQLARSLDSLAAADARAEVVARAGTLANSFARGENPPHFGRADVALILRALEREPAACEAAPAVAPGAPGAPPTREEIVEHITR
ncbi:MAG: hypothetical protein LC746_06675, partial [Acidobacteria bacterium]|nr:hypothetical protein [Acidobacteriota bacterium]